MQPPPLLKPFIPFKGFSVAVNKISASSYPAGYAWFGPGPPPQPHLSLSLSLPLPLPLPPSPPSSLHCYQVAALLHIHMSSFGLPGFFSKCYLSPIPSLHKANFSHSLGLSFPSSQRNLPRLFLSKVVSSALSFKNTFTVICNLFSMFSQKIILM